MPDEDQAGSDHLSPTSESAPTDSGDAHHKEAVSPPMPDRIGRYRLRGIIASGGMGTVYEAMQEHPRRRVALKVMKAGIASRSALRRFEYESQILARLRHPNIAHVYEAGTHDEGGGGVPFFAMEYVPNAKPITEYANDSDLSTHERLELFAGICDAVHHGHQKGIIHRDLKPANILIDSSGRPKVIDFGVARATDSDLAVTTLQTDIGQLIGTLQYMSPEQCDGDPEGLDIRSDIYALGVVLYELLCGRPPYDVSRISVLEVARIIRDEPPARPSTIDRTLRGDVETIALKALEKERSRRYQSAADLGRDIQRYLNDEPIQARPPSATYLIRKLLARNKRLVFTVLGLPILLVCILATAISSIFAAQSMRARDAAEEQRLIAETQRDRAERMFSQVRELARTFMFDFHDEIRDLDGSLPARELLATMALNYLDGLAQEAGDRPELIGELASAYERVGDIQGGLRTAGNVGDTARALQSYRTAAALRASLVEAMPLDFELRLEMSRGLIKIGDMLEQAGDTAAALERYRGALEIREYLARDMPRFRQALPIALNEVGSALVRMGRLNEAREYYDRSLVIAKELTTERPDDARLQRSLSVAYIRAGEILYLTGDYEAAAARYRDSVRIRSEMLEANPTSGRARRDAAVAHYFLGRALLKLEEPDEAMASLGYFFEVTRQRAEANPQSSRAARDLAAAHEAVGMAQVSAEDHVGARKSYEQFRALIVPLSESDPDNTHFRELVASSHERLAEVAMNEGDTASAIRGYREALTIIDSLVTANPENFQGKVHLARLLTGLGKVLARSGDQNEARSRLGAAREQYEALLAIQPETAEVREGLAETITVISQLSEPETTP
ncbi:MAG: protein kinase domain-containing protein [Planctomycetota bacterium]|jgi:tetratricopeptide (TPR) repeat protein/tRNA A-37 threonylcarbamoyl transferase component Bud32